MACVASASSGVQGFGAAGEEAELGLVADSGVPGLGELLGTAAVNCGGRIFGSMAECMTK
jgi:hypothetical protein